MSVEELREQRAGLWGSLQNIAEHSGELTTEMADQYDKLDADIRKLDAEIRSADIRERFEARKAEPTREAIAPGIAPQVETSGGGQDWGGYLRWFRSAGRDHSGIESRDLTTAADSAVVPDDLQAEVARLFGAVQGARQAVRVTQAPQDMRVPQVATRVSITAETDEGTAADETEPTFAEVDFTTDKKAFATTEMTHEILQDARVDLVREITLQHSEELSRFWSNTICNGLSTNTDAMFSASISNINTRTAAGAAAITAAELIAMRYEDLPAQYWSGGYGDLSWVMGQDTFAHIMTLADTTGRQLFQQHAASTLADGLSGTLLGLPVHIDAGAPALATGNTTVALVSRNAYRVVDREPGLVTQMDPYSKQSSGIVAVNSYWRSVGRWVRPQAAVVLTQA